MQKLGLTLCMMQSCRHNFANILCSTRPPNDFHFSLSMACLQAFIFIEAATKDEVYFPIFSPINYNVASYSGVGQHPTLNQNKN